MTTKIPVRETHGTWKFAKVGNILVLKIKDIAILAANSFHILLGTDCQVSFAIAYEMATDSQLRIDNTSQRVVCSILLSSLSIACTSTYYIWNERAFFFSIGPYRFENVAVTYLGSPPPPHTHTLWLPLDLITLIRYLIRISPYPSYPLGDSSGGVAWLAMGKKTKS